MTFPWLSMTELAIFHDQFRSQDSPNFSLEIHFWTISDTMSVTTFRMQIQVKFTIFQDHFRSRNFCTFFTRIHHWTILEITTPLTIFSTRIRDHFLLFHDFSYFCHFPWLFHDFPRPQIFPRLSLTFHDHGKPDCISIRSREHSSGSCQSFLERS